MPIDYNQLKSFLWSAADELRANSKLRSHEYSAPVLGLIFLRYADVKFHQVEARLQAGAHTSRRQVAPHQDPDRYRAEGVLFLPPEARYEHLLRLPEGSDLGAAINRAMEQIEAQDPGLKGTLPKTYQYLESGTLSTLLKSFNLAIDGVEGDVFGKIYEYFLGQFAKAEGQRGGEFFTPTSLVKLIVEVIEPFGGKILDPACGSGGMFVQSADFVARHRERGGVLSLYGQEKTEGTIGLARMNLAIHGLSGDIRQANSYYEDPHRSPGGFDFVMANPPFNVNNVDKERLKDDTARYPFGMPRADNGNYLWIQLFYSALNGRGRAGFVMANSASDARQSELDIRRQLIQAGAVDVMIAIGSNFFLTVTLPCTLWFLDRGKQGTSREGTVLFLDARPLYRQVDRALREFSEEQIAFLANIVRLYRDEAPEWPNDLIQNPKSKIQNEEVSYLASPAGQLSFVAPPVENGNQGATPLPEWDSLFPEGRYRDVPGLCKVATLAEIEAQGWSLNPGRYVGVADRADDEGDFAGRLEALNEELERLNAEAHELEARIAENVNQLLEG